MLDFGCAAAPKLPDPLPDARPLAVPPELLRLPILGPRFPLPMPLLARGTGAKTPPALPVVALARVFPLAAAA